MYTFSHHPYCHTGSAAENDVTQTPGILWKHHGDSAEMNCSHTKGAGYNQMYWYRQRQGETMSLVVFTSLGVTNDFGDIDKSKYSTVKTEADKGSLTVISVESDDSGIYFCSVSEHSVADSIQSWTKTSWADEHKTRWQWQLYSDRGTCCSIFLHYWTLLHPRLSLSPLIFTPIRELLLRWEDWAEPSTWSSWL